MTGQADAALEAEFDTVAGWTEQAVRRLGPDYAIPAACRGSANPAWLTWITDRLRLRADARFLDAGAGLGGPAAWLSKKVGPRPVLVEPMAGACGAAQRMFNLPIVTAWSQALPFPDRAFDAAWCLGVLCTTPDKAGLLNELRRVLTNQGRLGLLVLVQIAAELAEAPEGNHFPNETSLLADLAAAGFLVDDQIEVSKVEGVDDDWHDKAAEVERSLEADYGQRLDWQVAKEQEERIGRLLRAGHLQTWLVTTRVGGRR